MADYQFERDRLAAREVRPPVTTARQPTTLHAPAGPLGDVTRRADATTLRDHAAGLQRLAASSPRLAHDAARDLQQHHGNRYVQHAVAIAQRPGVGSEPLTAGRPSSASGSRDLQDRGAGRGDAHDGKRVYPVRGAIGAAVGFGLGGPVGALVGGAIGAFHKNVKVNVTELTGAGGSLGRDLVRANIVWAQANISVTTGTRTTGLSGAGILNGSNELDEFSGPALTAGEQALVTHNRSPGRITVYYVPSLSDGSRGETIMPSYHGAGAGPDDSIVMSSTGRASDTFAHELGHALGLDHAAHAWQIMAPGTIRWTMGPSLLSPWEISAARKSKYAT